MLHLTHAPSEEGKEQSCQQLSGGEEPAVLRNYDVH